MTEVVAKYIYDDSVDYGFYRVFACYDSLNEYDKRKVSFYDIYDSHGNCVNEGEPFYSFPSWQEIYECYWLPTVQEASKTHKRDLTYFFGNESKSIK